MKSFFAAACLALPVSALAQGVVIMPTTQSSVLRTGTPIALTLSEGITTKDKQAHVNDRVRMEVAEDVTVNGTVIIPVGSPAVGELTDVQNKGMWGKSGRVVGRVLTVNANGRTIRLSGTFDSKGGSGTAGAVAASAIVFAPAGFLITGKSATLAPGAVIRAFIDEDVPFAIAADAPPPASPMVVKRR